MAERWRWLWRLAWAVSATYTLGSLAGACAQSGEQHGTGGAGGIDLGQGGAGGLDPDAACALYEHHAITKPVNLYIMFDKSSSMAGNKWEAAKQGLIAFVEDPSSAGLSVALRFFPRPANTTPACDQQAYATPTVPFSELPAGAPAIVAAVEAETPDGFSTPIYPALGGALLGGIDVANAKPGEVSAVLLVTDGAPEGPAATCGGVDPEDPQVIADLAATGAAYDPPVLTYVVGLPGVDQSAANLIAQGGGTGTAILVASGDVAQNFADALAMVRGNALPCAYEIPEEVTNGQVALGKVNIEITDAGTAETIPLNPDCDGPGWHYDDPSMPTSIELCPDTCNQLKSTPDIAIQVVLGCNTLVK